MVSSGGESLAGRMLSVMELAAASSTLEKSKRSSTMKWSEEALTLVVVLLSEGNCGQKLVWKNSCASMAGVVLCCVVKKKLELKK